MQLPPQYYEAVLTNAAADDLPFKLSLAAVICTYPSRCGPPSNRRGWARRLETAEKEGESGNWTRLMDRLAFVLSVRPCCSDSKLPTPPQSTQTRNAMCVVVRRAVLACASRGVGGGFLSMGTDRKPLRCPAQRAFMHCIYGMYVCMSFGAGAAWA